METNRKRIASYHDLEVYRNTYTGMISIFKEILPKLPKSEGFDLYDQLFRASKAVPRLIAEGYAKRHQRMGFQKYLDDATAECNEILVSLCQCQDLYGIKCEEIADLYDKSGRQLYKLSLAWTNFKSKGTRQT